MDHIPEADRFHSWFMDAYGILINSKGESRMIPLSELKIYSDTFGLICSFQEFVKIIYAIDETYNKHKLDKESSK